MRKREMRSGRSAVVALVAALGALALGACAEPELDTRTFEVEYLSPGEVDRLVEPYVFADREGRPGRMSSARGALTVRETDDNLARIERALEQFDRPRPSVMLHFQIIEADGAAEADPAIEDVERELRRLFRFEGYELVAETQVAGIEGTMIRQTVGDPSSDRGFLIEGGVSEVRSSGGTATVTVDVALSTLEIANALQTTVTVPVGHSIVLGTARTPSYAGALILVVRAELMGQPAP